MSAWHQNVRICRISRASSSVSDGPGPRRQVRWVGKGSGAQGRVPKRLERILGALDAGGADLENARRSVSMAVTFRTAIGALGARDGLALLVWHGIGA